MVLLKYRPVTGLHFAGSHLTSFRSTDSCQALRGGQVYCCRFISAESHLIFSQGGLSSEHRLSVTVHRLLLLHILVVSANFRALIFLSTFYFKNSPYSLL